MSRDFYSLIKPCGENPGSLESFSNYIEAKNQELIQNKLNNYIAIDIEGKKHNLDEIIFLPKSETKNFSFQDDIIYCKSSLKTETASKPSFIHKYQTIFTSRRRNSINNPFRRLLTEQ